MAVRFFRTADKKKITKTSSGFKNPVLPGLPEEPGEWIEISSSEYYWCKQGFAKRPNPPRRKTRLDLAVELAQQGPEAVHAYCMKHYGHGSGTRSTKLSESV